LALRCPASKFITHTLSHMSFLFLLAAATFRLDGATHPISSAGDSTPAAAAAPLTAGSDDATAVDDYADSIENVIKSTFRPANILMTNVQICLMFWIFGTSLSRTHISGFCRATRR